MTTETESTDLDPFRPQSWDELIGQSGLKMRLTVSIAAALSDGRALDNVLLTGPPGVGKTSTGRIIANAMGYNFASFVMPVDERTMYEILFDNERSVILLDEIHRCSTTQQESFLTLIEDGYYQDKKGRKHEVENLTFIGATTEKRKVIEPLRDRFLIKPEFQEYSLEDMGRIVSGMAQRFGVEFTPEEAIRLGRATGGTPRNAREFVIAARDLATVYSQRASVEQILTLCGMDDEGLGIAHGNYLSFLRSNGGTAGLNVLSSVLQESPGTVEIMEKLLVKLGYITYTSAGRELTQAGFKKVTRIHEGS